MAVVRVWLVAALVSVALASACKRSSAPSPSASTARSTAPVAAPAGLIGDLCVVQPAGVWQRLRALGGPVAELLPAGYPLLISSMLGLPPLSASSLDEELPLVGAVLALPGDKLGSVLGAHVVDGRELIATLSTGSAAEFRTEAEPKSGATFLVKKSKALPVVLAVLDNYLLIANEREAIEKAGAYVTRTLSKRPPSSDPITFSVGKEALRGALAKSLRDTWRVRKADLERRAQEEQRKQGRAPDFADPMAVLLGADMAVESLLSAIETAEGARVILDPRADRLLARVEMQPAKDGALRDLYREMVTGDLRPLLELPARTKLAFLQRRKSRLREEDAKSAGEEWVRLFGERLSEKEATRVRDAFSSWELGRGEAAVYGLLPGDGANVVLRSDVVDAKALERGARGILGLVKMPIVAAPISHFVGKPSLRESTLRLPDVDAPVARAELTLTQPKAEATRIEFLWLVETTAAFGAAGTSSKESLSELLSAAKGKAPKLADDTELSAMATRLGAGASHVLFIDVGRLLGVDSKAEPMPALLSLGKDAKSVVLKLDVSRSALSTLIRASVRR